MSTECRKSLEVVKELKFEGVTMELEEKKTFCEQHFGKRCRELMPEEKREFFRLQKRLSRNGTIKKKPKRTPEEKKEYYKQYYQLHKEEKRIVNQKYWEGHRKVKNKDVGLAVKVFGKRWKELSAEEKREYNRIRQIIYLERKKGAERNGMV